MNSMAESDITQIGHIQPQDNLKVTKPVEHEWSKGTAYQLTQGAQQLKRIAAALEVTAESVSDEDTKTTTEGKLWEIDNDATKVHVVIKDSDNDSGTLFFIK